MGTEPNPADHPTPETAAAAELEQTLFEVKRVIVGQDRLVERLLVALLADGHCLLEGVPGVAKTLAAQTLATAVGGRSRGSSSRRTWCPRTSWAPGSTGRRRSPSTWSWARSWPTWCWRTRSTGRRRRCSPPCWRRWPSGRSRSAATVPGPRPVPGAGHPEPDRVRGRLPPAGGAAGPVPHEGRRRLPDRRRGAGHPLPDERRAAGRPPGARPGAAARPAGADPQGLRAPRPRRVRRAAGARHPRAGPVRRQRDHHRSSRTAPARAPPSAWSPPPGRSRCCAAATTCCPPTSPSWPWT